MVILIADDFEDSRILLKKTLELAGYSVVTATNGLEALNKVRDSLPDMIISDIQMPVMDGYRFCREVKYDAELRKIPFIFYTATYTDRKDEKLAIALGASRYIVKPVESESFLKTIKEVISEHKENKNNASGALLQEDPEFLKMYEERIGVKLDKKIKALEMERNAFLQKEAELRASEEKYRSVFDNINDAIFIHNIKDVSILDVNQKMCEMFGFTHEEALQLRMEDICAYDTEYTRETSRKYIQKTINEGPQIFQWKCKDKAGRIFWVEINLKLINLDGQDRLIAVVRDISQSKKAKEALVESEKRFRTIFESSPVGISIARRDGILINSNPAFQKMLGYTKEELARNFLEITYPDDVPKNLRLFTDMVEGKRDHYWMEKRYIHKNGSIIWANLIVTVIRDRDGAFKYNFAIVENITERKKLEDRLRHAQKLEAIGQLAAGVAHDFNNILTAIIGYGNLLKMKLRDNEQLSHSINQLLAITERGAGLTQSLLAFSRKQIISLKPVNLNALVERIGKLIPRFIGEQIEFRKNLSSKNITIMADSSQLEQVLMNLAGNARDAMPEGGVLTIDTALVELDACYVKMHGFGSPGPYALITVSDTGTGIDAETMDKIFEPFFTTKEVGEGTGLGLSLVYGIIKQHEGYINVCSEPGHGATFKIHIPLAKETAKEGAGTDDQPAIGGTETILLAEDEKEVRSAIKGILEEYGFTVIEAADGKEAVGKFLAHKSSIQLLVFDVVMPNMSGKEAFAAIRRINPGMKVIFTSGYKTITTQANDVIEDGTIFISKPVQPQYLLQKIREAIDES